MTHLFFLYRKSRRAWGSTTMRAHQLSQIVAPYLPGVEVHLQAFSRHLPLQLLWARFVPRASVIFATKYAMEAIHPETIRNLHRRDCRVCFDVVDTRRDHLPGPELAADCFISPSLSGVARLQAHVDRAWGDTPKPLVAPVLHNADQRLYDRRIRPQDSARTVYWGAIRYAVRSEAIDRQVTCFDGSDAAGFAASLDKVLDYNVHYAVRPTDPEDLRIKPFTKGANAATLGALVLADRSVPDAIDFLGEDYPFLLPTNTEAAVLDGLAHLREAFGGPDWHLAQDRCRDMAERVSPMALAAQIAHIIKETQGGGQRCSLPRRNLP